jgi:putative solute:sodium symporter small subunit
MTEKGNEYRFSMLRPTTDLAKGNKKLILTLVAIWFLAIYGFHIVMKLIEEPVKEPALVQFEDVFQKIQDGTASTADQQQYVNALMHVLGKSTLRDMVGKKKVNTNSATGKTNREILQWALSNVVYELLPEDKRARLVKQVEDIDLQKAKIAEIKARYEKGELVYEAYEDEYFEAKAELNKQQDDARVIIDDCGASLGLKEGGLILISIPEELTTKGLENVPEEYMAELPGIMQLYLTHYQSVLTDTLFLGFPFHYWYTAEFLLILFVLLCWVYCIRIERLHKKLGIEE